MKTATLHLIVEPLCGWCYGAAPLFEASMGMEDIDVKVHFGGMLMDERRKRITPEWRDFVTGPDTQIAKLTGQVFGGKYQKDLLNDFSAVLDSEPPITAILAAQSLGVEPLKMLNGLQKAMYVNGKRIADFDVLVSVAVENGLDPVIFAKTYDACWGQDVRQAINTGRQKMNDIAGNGFPSAALEDENGNITPLEIGHYYGHPDAWKKHLRAHIQ